VCVQRIKAARAMTAQRIDPMKFQTYGLRGHSVSDPSTIAIVSTSPARDRPPLRVLVAPRAGARTIQVNEKQE
jgi:hypothetical protein